MNKIKPLLDYVLAEKIVKDTGVVTNTDVRDTHQLFKVIAVGAGRYENGMFVIPRVSPGDVVWVQKHAAEGDTPSELQNKGLALFMASRIMAIDEGV